MLVVKAITVMVTMMPGTRKTKVSLARYPATNEVINSQNGVVILMFVLLVVFGKHNINAKKTAKM